jgi:methionyl-tRNA formyltransferase
MRVLFWGTPSFAVPTLRAIAEEGHEVVSAITQPDRPAGRGLELRGSSVKAVALAEGIPVLEPQKPRGDEFIAQIRALEPEVSVVVAYGHILKREVLDVPSLGSINVHASLLPELRGAAPIPWAIARGHTTTGVTVMRMVEAMDAGPILLQEEEPIIEKETATELASRLAEVGAEALVAALALLSLGQLVAREQDESRVTYAPKLSRDDARVDWNKSAHEVSNLLRAMDEAPGGWSSLHGEPVKLFRPEPVGDSGAGPGSPGEVLAADPKAGLLVSASGGALRIHEVQPPGKRRMPALDWIRGRGVERGARFD